MRRPADPQPGPDAGAYRPPRIAERGAAAVELSGRGGFTETGIAMCLRPSVEADAL